jgi:predicted MFS family arabinose efflux permease
MTGWTLFCGGLGAMAATAPVEAALQLTDWRGVFLTMSVLTFAASAAIFWLVPERVSAGGDESLREQLQGVARVFGSTAFWRLAAASPLFQATNMALQGLWAGPWLADVAGLNRDEVAVCLLALAAATTAGFLFWAWPHRGSHAAGRLRSHCSSSALPCFSACSCCLPAA